MDAAAAQAEHLRAIESLLAFWADAGVEAMYADAPVARSAPPGRPSAASPRPPAAPPPTPSRFRVAPSASETQSTARALASAANDLDALAAAAALAAGADWRGYSFYRGDPKNDLVVVVDAPDDDDRREGRPASGAKGRLLDRMLVAGAMDGRALVVNATLPGNADPSTFAPFVERALALVRPRAVIAAGGVAARLFFPSDQPIPRLRGSWTEWRDPDLDVSAPVLATFSPTLLLGQPAAKKFAWRDIMTLQARLEALSAADLG